MSHRVDSDELRGVVYVADAEALVGVLTGWVWPDHALQLVGDAVLILARERRDDVEAAARRCVRELRDREWEGDAELATQIEAGFGWGPTRLVNALRIGIAENRLAP